MASSPYYLFGAQRRPYQWHGGPGGVPQAARAAETRELGNVTMEDSGLGPYSMSYPAFTHTHLHDPTGDWPAVRPAGPEPLDPHGLSGDDIDGGKLIKAAAVCGLLYLALKAGGALGKRRNPGKAYKVFKRSARNWEEFSRARKMTVRSGLSYDEAQTMCRRLNAELTKREISRGTKYEFVSV